MRDQCHLFVKAIAVKCNKYTTRHISKGGQFLHLKMIRSTNAKIF